MGEDYTLEDVEVWLKNSVTKEVFKRILEKAVLLERDTVNCLVSGKEHTAINTAVESKTLRGIVYIGNDLIADLEENKIDET